MSGKLKLMIGGLVLGILVIFAFLGVKSLFAPSQPISNTADSDWQQPLVMPNANVPSPDAIGNSNIFTRPLNDKPVEEDDKTVELVGEPDTTETAPAKTPPATPPADEPATEVALDKLPAEEVTTQPEPPAAQPPVSANTGTLEIVAQTETGKAIKANVYVQQSNGANIDKATYTSKASFALKPGTYKITVRAEGYGSLTRNIRVPNGAVVNEIFPLPAIAASKTPVPTQPPRQPAPAPVAQTPAQPAPQPAGDGRLRVVALSADDGSPLPVDFTITRLDGSVIDHINGVPMTELSLPAQEFVVSFNFRGLQGYKSLVVRPGQTTTHTFNIRGVGNNSNAGNQPPPNMGETQPPLPLPPDMGQMQPQQPQNLEEMLLQRIQQELEKQMTN